MYFFNDLIFEINKNKYLNLKPLETYLKYPDIFLKAYTDINEKEISKMIYEEKEALVKYVYEKLDITNENLFLNIMKSFVNKYNKNITYYMMSFLSSLGYKINEMKKWDLEDLIETFFLEGMINNKLSDFSNIIHNYYSQETKETFDKAFDIEDKNFKEREELAAKLERL